MLAINNKPSVFSDYMTFHVFRFFLFVLGKILQPNKIKV